MKVLRIGNYLTCEFLADTNNFILTLILRPTPILDSMLRTSMIASQAHGAIRFPLRLALHQLNIMHRTTLLA